VKANYVRGLSTVFIILLEVHSLTHSLTHGAGSQHFMEPEGSLPCSQEPSTGPYPEPDQSNPHHPILSL
jgi:hypothetical protein